VRRSLSLLLAGALLLSACAESEDPPSAPGAECTDSAECDDDNPCTRDLCYQGACANPAEPLNTPCPDEDPCNGEEYCNGEGECWVGQPPSCEDDDPCTVDTCDPATGECLRDPVAGCCNEDADCPSPGPCQQGRCDPDEHTCSVEEVVDCCRVDEDCSSDDPCHGAGTCDPDAHTCAFEQLPDCCSQDADCPGDGPCQQGRCDPDEHTCSLEEVPGCCTDHPDCVSDDPCDGVGICDPDTHTCSWEGNPSCCTEDDDCVADQPCVHGTCDQEARTCSFEPIAGCCSRDLDCADGLLCVEEISRCVQPGAEGDVLLSELMVEPGQVDDSLGEWIELYNASPHELSLGGWVLVIDGEEPGFRLPTAEPLVLAPEEFVVLGRSLEVAQNGAVPVDALFEGAELGADGGQVELRDPFGVSVVTFAWDASYPVEDGAALVLSGLRMDPALSELPESWCAAPEAWGAGTDLGSPGAANPDCPAVDDEDQDGWPTGLDCDDRDPALNHDDDDNDGYSTCAGDCDDLDPQRSPADNDLDGYSGCGGDCDDVLQNVHPEAEELCGNDRDDDCDGWVDVAANCPLPVRINEVVADLGPDDPIGAFIELKGPAGLALSGARLEHVDARGALVARLELVDVALGDDGYFLIAHPDAQPRLAGLADLQDPIADLIDAPAGLRLLAAGVVADAVAWGPVSEDAEGEGPPAALVEPQHALARRGGQDTDDNAADFVEAAPSPRAELRAVDSARLLEPLGTLELDPGAATPPLRAEVALGDVAGRAGPIPELVAEVGYGPRGTLPWEGERWVFAPAEHAQDADDIEVWAGQLGDLAPGSYDWCMRFGLDGVYWVYADGPQLGSQDGYHPLDAGHIEMAACDDLLDQDDDGTPCAEDCDDLDPSLDAADRDSDGYSTCSGDCDDRDAALRPVDGDRDGVTSCEGDCDDRQRDTYPGAPGVCGDGRDNDCNGLADADDEGECAPALPVVINEVLYDPNGPDPARAFVELHCARPSVRLLGHVLRVHDAAGASLGEIPLGDVSVGPAGFAVVAHPLAELALRDVAAELSELADLPNDAGSLVLLRDGAPVDALAWGAPEQGHGEGAPAVDVIEGHSLSRDEQHSDSGDNASDFRSMALPSPGADPRQDAIGYAALQWPLDPIDLPEAGPSPPLYGRVWVPGVTEGPGQGLGVEAELCWGPAAGTEADLADWTCAPAEYNGDLVNRWGELADDEYVATALQLPCGTHAYLYRFRTQLGQWLWADLPPEGSLDGYQAAQAGVVRVCACDAGVDRDGDGSSCDVDCDDADPDLDTLDQDGDGVSTCDGDCDDDAELLHTFDRDGDGLSPCAGDCDDTRAAVLPGAAPVCADGLDNDCDGGTDDAAECPAPVLLRINEVLPDEPGADGEGVFVELWGEPSGAALAGFRLEQRALDGALLRTLDLSERVLGEDGYLLVAAPAAGPALAALADVLDPIADGTAGGGVLQLWRWDERADALAWGEADAALGEGARAPQPPPGRTLTRDPDHGDTDDNATDFYVAPVGSPRADPLPPTVDFAAIQWPRQGALAVSGQPSEPLYGRVYVAGRTSGEGQAPGVQAEVCYGRVGTTPDTWDPAGCAAAEYQGDLVDPWGELSDDEYVGRLRVAEAGQYAFAYRFQVDGGEWVWADLGPEGTSDGYSVDTAGLILVAVCAEDADRDGVPCSLDCDDGDPDVHPDAAEICDDERDNDCNDLTDADDPACQDADEDGVPASEDCDDRDPLAHPGLREVCADERDNDCDGDSDEGDSDCAGPGAPVLIDEVAAWVADASPDGYVELWGQPHGGLNGFWLATYDVAGEPLGEVELDGLRLDALGYSLVAHPGAGPALLDLAVAHSEAVAPSPDGGAVQLWHRSVLVDALSWGQAPARLGEGPGAPLMAAGGSLTRDSIHTDRDHNRADFSSLGVSTPGGSAPGVEYAGIERPQQTIEACAGFSAEFAFVRVYVPERTPGEGQGAGVIAEVGVGPVGSHPAVAPGAWSWAPTLYQQDLLNPWGELSDDEYGGEVPTVEPGAWSVAFRVSLDGGPWRYADLGPVGTADGYAPGDTLPLTVQQPCTIDRDGDGATADVDCDDRDPERSPLIEELCDDEVDNDCDDAVDLADPYCQPPAEQVLIGEVCYDDASDDGEHIFVELAGPAGLVLDGWRLVRHTSDGRQEATLDLSGGAIGDDGFYLIAHPDADEALAELADLQDDFVDLPNTAASLVLRANAFVADALAWGPVQVNLGEGSPAPDVPAEHSLSRSADLQDSDDNSLDFVELAQPTPRAGPPATPVDYAALETPLEDIIVCEGQPLPTIVGRVYVEGVTPGVQPGVGILGQLGFGPLDSDPAADPGWTWVAAEWSHKLTNEQLELADDAYRANLRDVPAGDWLVAYRFRVAGGPWAYADLPPGTNDGFSADTTLRLEVHAPCDLDGDGDGSFADVDCDDGDGANFPGNPEDCADEQDNDCDGAVDDADEDCVIPEAPLVIGELFYDPLSGDGPEAFIELHGTPGEALDGLTLRSYTRLGLELEALALDGLQIGEDGFLMVMDPDAKPDMEALADVLHPVADLQNSGGSLRIEDADGAALDALTYGSGAPELGEGGPARDVRAGRSLSRDAAWTDTGNNAADFLESAIPTPRMSRHAQAIAWAGRLLPEELVSIASGEATPNLSGEVFVPGEDGTVAPAAHPRVRAQLGYRPYDELRQDPLVDASGWTFVEAAFTVDVGDNDEYGAVLSDLSAGRWDFCFRFSINNGLWWTYADRGEGYADGGYNDPGEILVQAP